MSCSGYNSALTTVSQPSAVTWRRIYP